MQLRNFLFKESFFHYFFIILFFILLSPSSTAQAATIRVNTTDDRFDEVPAPTASMPMNVVFDKIEIVQGFRGVSK